jgi:hypothetical protein
MEGGEGRHYGEMESDRLLERWSGEGRPVAGEVDQEGGDGDLRWAA